MAVCSSVRVDTVAHEGQTRELRARLTRAAIEADDFSNVTSRICIDAFKHMYDDAMSMRILN